MIILSLIFAPERVSNTLDLYRDRVRLLRTMVRMSVTVVLYNTILLCYIIPHKKHTRFHIAKKWCQVILLHHDNFCLHHHHRITSSIKNIIETMNARDFYSNSSSYIMAKCTHCCSAVHFFYHISQSKGP